MVKRLLTLATLVIALSAAVAPAHAQGNSEGDGNGNGQGDGNGQGGGNGQGSENSQAGAGDSSDAAAPAGESSAAPDKPVKSDEDIALEAVQSDSAVPLGDILQSVRQDTNDKVIDAQLFSFRGDLVYEVKVMSAGGHVSRFYYEASSGRQLGPN